MSLAIRHESKSTWERRTAIPPELAGTLIERGIAVKVERSPQRIFSDAAYEAAGAELVEGAPEANLVCGIKEMPLSTFRKGGAYLFFAHVIKGQPYNMPMLRRMLDLGCTLIDYERITDDNGRRLVFFGREAGLAGMVDTLWTLGQKLAVEGIDSPFDTLKPTHQYADLGEAMSAVTAVGDWIREHGVPESLHPLIIGVAGYGNVAGGVQQILQVLPTQELTPEQIGQPLQDRSVIYRVTFEERHLARRSDGTAFELQDYYLHPENYESDFGRYLPHLSVLMNCIYWTERYPRLLSISDVGKLDRCRVIGDISCDVGGAIEITVKATDPGDPVYTWDSATSGIRMGVHAGGPVVCAVDILPAELPKEASERFATALLPYIEAMATADYRVPFHALDVPAPIKRAIIAHGGILTPDYTYLSDSLNEPEPSVSGE